MSGGAARGAGGARSIALRRAGRFPIERVGLGGGVGVLLPIVTVGRGPLQVGRARGDAVIESGWMLEWASGRTQGAVRRKGERGKN